MFRNFALPLLLLSTAVPAVSQFLNYGSGQLPTCAQGCQTLQQAQQACTTSDQKKSCFCQSAYLTQLYASPSAVCAQNCQPSDLQQIQNWYVGFCRNPNAQVPASGNSPPPAQSSGSSSQTSGQNSGTNSHAEVAGEGGPSSGSDGSWWDNHGRWIAMVIVLIVGFAIIIVVALWLKKRHYRRAHNSMPLPVGWAPNSNPHNYPDAVEKGGGANPRTAAESVGQPADLAAAVRQNSQKRKSKGKLTKWVSG